MNFDFCLLYFTSFHKKFYFPSSLYISGQFSKAQCFYFFLGSFYLSNDSEIMHTQQISFSFLSFCWPRHLRVGPCSVSVLCLRTGFPCHNPLPPFKLIRFWYQFETGTWWPWIGAKGRWWMPFLKPGTNGLFSLCYQIAF